MLEDLVISKVRVKILTLFFTHPNKIFHVREIVRQTQEEINAVRRELLHLEKAGLFTKERRANRLYYRLRRDYVLFNEILEIINKTSGMGGEIIKNKPKLGKIKYAAISGRFVKNLDRVDKNEVDLLIVGDVVLPELSQIIKVEEAKVSREINYTVMTEEEFQFRKKRRDPFVIAILERSKVMIIGDEESLIT